MAYLEHTELFGRIVMVACLTGLFVVPSVAWLFSLLKHNGLLPRPRTGRSGFLWFSRDDVFHPSPSSFTLLAASLWRSWKLHLLGSDAAGSRVSMEVDEAGGRVSMEVDEAGGRVSIEEDVIEYHWGKDLSGTIGVAGGVGGLLYLTISNSSTPNSFTRQLYVPWKIAVRF